MFNKRFRKSAGKKGRDCGLPKVMDRRQSGEEDQMFDNGGNREQGGVAVMMQTDTQTQMVAAPGNFQFTFEFGQRSNHGSYIEPEVSRTTKGSATEGTTNMKQTSPDDAWVCLDIESSSEDELTNM